MTRPISAAGAAAIKKFESCRLEAYQDAVGVWTIGWGSTRGVHAGMTLTQAEADQRFLDDLVPAETAVSRLVTVPLSDGQYAALVDFVFNCGAGTLEHSTLLRKLNAGDYAAVATELPRFHFAHGVSLKGLVLRRAAEVAMWNGDPHEHLLDPAAAAPKAKVDPVEKPAAPAATAPASPSAATKAPATMTSASTSALAAAHPTVAAALPGVDFFQGIVNFGEHIVGSLGAGAAAIVNPAIEHVTGQPDATIPGQPSGSGFFGTLENVRGAAGKIGQIVADAKSGDVREAIADGVDLLKLIFATLDVFHVDVPVLSTVVESLGSLHAGADKPA